MFDVVLPVVQVLLSAILIGLVLMHSGRDTGFGGMGFTPASQGGQHIVERQRRERGGVIGHRVREDELPAMQEAVVGISHVKRHFQPRMQLTPVSCLVSRLARSASDDRVEGT